MPIDSLFFNNGRFSFVKGQTFKVKTIRDTQEQDWKTALAHNIQPIPFGEFLDAVAFDNCYGSFLKVRYKDMLYYINPKDCDFIGI